jgi:hypothetical protein
MLYTITKCLVETLAAHALTVSSIETKNYHCALRYNLGFNEQKKKFVVQEAATACAKAVKAYDFPHRNLLPMDP